MIHSILMVHSSQEEMGTFILVKRAYICTFAAAIFR